MSDLTERVREVIGDHHPVAHDSATCSCGADGLSDHHGHVAEQIIDRLGLKPETDDVRKRIRYATAWLDWELTIMEGAQS